VYPKALPLISQIANAAELPALETMVVELSNEVDALPGPIVIVLDDVHLLTSPDCVAMVSELLRHPPEAVHFVLVSRHEPPSSAAAQQRSHAAGRQSPHPRISLRPTEIGRGEDAGPVGLS